MTLMKEQRKHAKYTGDYDGEPINEDKPPLYLNLAVPLS